METGVALKQMLHVAHISCRQDAGCECAACMLMQCSGWEMGIGIAEGVPRRGKLPISNCLFMGRTDRDLWRALGRGRVGSSATTKRWRRSDGVMERLRLHNRRPHGHHGHPVHDLMFTSPLDAT